MWKDGERDKGENGITCGLINLPTLIRMDRDLPQMESIVDLKHIFGNYQYKIKMYLYIFILGSWDLVPCGCCICWKCMYMSRESTVPRGSGDDGLVWNECAQVDAHKL